MRALGGDGRGVIGIDNTPSDPEELLGVWRDCFGPDGFHGLVPGGQRHVESIANIAAFVPFGFFLAEFLASLNRTGTGTGSCLQVGWALLAAFGLSLCIECLQLVLKVGFFEVTDLVGNGVGARKVVGVKCS